MMKANKLFTPKGILFLLIFSALVFVGDKINFSKLVGAENQFFTLFQLFGPVAGAFLGPVVGVLSVLIAEVASKLMNPATVWNNVTLLRLAPMLFAAWYFGTRKDKISFAIPIIAIIAFVAHPIGRQAWFFTLFWTIPLIVKALPKKYSEKAFARSLGATFTAHAVGGAIWCYFVPMTAAAWTALIPVVIFERLVFASGITISYVGINTLLDRLDSKLTLGYLNIEKRYVLFRQTA